MSLIIIFGCVPPAFETPNADVEQYKYDEECEDYPPCNAMLSIAAENWRGHHWRDAIDNYNKLFKCGCTEIKDSAGEIYKYLGYSYRQLGLYDSAAYIFDQGLKFIQEDIELLEYAGENAGKLNKVEKQIYYYDKILSFEENNLEILEMLSNVYRDREMYEDQVSILNIWLNYEPTSKNANAEKKAAFAALGKDESDVDRERWESETSNIQYGLDYIRSLQDAGNIEKIIEVCKELLVYEKYNTTILRSLGDAYLNLYKEDEALNIYNTLAKVDPTNYDVAIDISKILVNKEKFSESLDWAEKAVSMSGQTGKSIYQRAEVYFSVAESCSGDPLTFWDKVVYEVSWEDYKTASNKGYIQAKTRRDFVGENFITTPADWFMRPDGEKEVEPQGECYSWIKKSVKRKI